MQKERKREGRKEQQRQQLGGRVRTSGARPTRPTVRPSDVLCRASAFLRGEGVRQRRTECVRWRERGSRQRENAYGRPVLTDLNRNSLSNLLFVKLIKHHKLPRACWLDSTEAPIASRCWRSRNLLPNSVHVSGVGCLHPPSSIRPTAYENACIPILSLCTHLKVSTCSYMGRSDYL